MKRFKVQHIIAAILLLILISIVSTQSDTVILIFMGLVILVAWIWGGFLYKKYRQKDIQELLITDPSNGRATLNGYFLPKDKEDEILELLSKLDVSNADFIKAIKMRDPEYIRIISVARMVGG